MDKKVLIISESSVFYNLEGNFIVRGGGASAMHNLAKAFVDLGSGVEFFAIKEFEEQKNEEVIDGVFYKRVISSSRSSFKLLKFLFLARKIAKDYDFVVLNQFLPHLLLPFLRKKKTLAVVHDVYMGKKRFWFKRFTFFVAFFGFVVEILQLKFDKYFADKVMAVSLYTRDKLLKKFGKSFEDKVFVNSYPISRGEYSFKDLKKEKYLLFVGRFVSYKNPDHVLNLLNNVKNEYRDLRVKFVVTRKFEKYFEEFRRKVFEMGISDRVDFEFSVSTKRLRELYAGALILVHPSVVEGQGIVVLEALASKVPVLAYDLPAYKGMLVSGKNSELCEFENQEDLFKGLKKIMENYEFYRANTFETLNEFSYEKFLDNLRDNFFKGFDK